MLMYICISYSLSMRDTVRDTVLPVNLTGIKFGSLVIGVEPPN